jgi:monoamine oxidase
LTLADYGAPPTVEARGRVGGRVWTVEAPGGDLAELGGEWIFEDDTVLQSLAARFGLGLAQIGVDFRSREARGGLGATVDEQRQFLRSASVLLASMSSQEVASTTLGEFLSRVPGTARQKATVRARLQGTIAVDLDRVALRVADQNLFRTESGRQWRMTKGNQALAVEMAGRVHVRLNCRVTAVRTAGRETTIVVGSGDREEAIMADAVVVAVPLPVLREISFDPALPGDLIGAIASTPMGDASKLVVPTAGAPPLVGVQSVEGPFWCWTGLDADARVRRCLTAFAGSSEAQVSLQTSGGDPGRWVSRVRSLVPEMPITGPALLHHWGSDPMAGGSYSAVSNEPWGTIAAFERPLGSLVLAGEHTAGVRWHGTMEGALRSGIRAARQVIDLA